MYYSSISDSIVTEAEAHAQIVQLCERWFQAAHPNKNFEKYFIKHPELILIDQWSSFQKIDASAAKRTVEPDCNIPW